MNDLNELILALCAGPVYVFSCLKVVKKNSIVRANFTRSHKCLIFHVSLTLFVPVYFNRAIVRDFN